MPNRTLVPDKLQGYLLQVKHMLHELISVDDRIVSIEMLDDVAVETEEGIISEQIKSVTSSNNPISERSPVFWKTLYNWCKYIEDDSLPIDAVLRFVVVASTSIASGEIQNTFASAKTDEDALKALEFAMATLLKSNGFNSSADMYQLIPDSYRKYVRFLFDGDVNSFVDSPYATSANSSVCNDLRNAFGDW